MILVTKSNSKGNDMFAKYYTQIIVRLQVYDSAKKKKKGGKQNVVYKIYIK